MTCVLGLQPNNDRRCPGSGAQAPSQSSNHTVQLHTVNYVRGRLVCNLQLPHHCEIAGVIVEAGHAGYELACSV